MKARVIDRLERINARQEEIAALLATPEAQSDSQQFAALSQEYAQLQPLTAEYQALRACRGAIAEAEQLASDGDAELRALAEEELDGLRQQAEQIEHALQLLLLPKDPDDDRPAFLEIRAGTGGAEAALFAGDLLKMYLRYAEQRGWKTEMISASAGEMGGYKEVITRIGGRNVYQRLKFESGTHRVQRVPATESQGRIHTSACTVAVLPEAEQVDAVDINPADLRIDTYRASGAGGQHVNKTDSAVRITHLPSGLVVECQDERSQHKNRARAMSLLQSRLLAQEKDSQAAERAATRKLLVGSGDRSQRIRTYNFPQGRMTDHRINLTLYKLEEMLRDGDLDPVIEPLLQEDQAAQLAELGGDN